MRDKVEYCIENIENKVSRYFSSLKYDLCDISVIDTLKQNSFVIFSINDKMGVLEILMKTKHGFHFHFKKETSNLFLTTIYYFEETKAELDLFLKLLKKI